VMAVSISSSCISNRSSSIRPRSAPAAPPFNSGDDLHRRHTRPCPFRRSYKRR
jgi:hypothetical protein